MPPVDPITREVVQNGLITVVREMSLTVQRAAYSPIIHEVKDYSSVLLLPNSDLVAEAEGIPSFLGAMPATLPPVLGRYDSSSIAAGDVFVSNDPYSANGTHKNDINVIAPIFWQDDLAFFAVTKAHWSDIGGKDPGSWSPDAVSTFQEGLSIPPLRLFRAGELNEEALNLILANTREPEDNHGDLMAQIAACTVAERRVGELLERYGRATVEACIESLFEYVEARMRSEINNVPDGTYTATQIVESDGVTEDPFQVTARVVVAGTDVTCDFTGQEPQRYAAAGNINRVCLEAMCRVALKCLLAPTLPANQGLYRPITVLATPGTVTHPTHPAPCTTWGDMGYAVYEAIFEALAPVLSDRVVAGIFGYGQTMAIVGPPASTGASYVHFMPYAGGWGGREGKDGLSATCPLFNGDNFNVPCEVIEHEFPLIVERYELIEDSAGAGQYRGGLGVRTDYRVLDGPAEVFASFNRHRIPARGLFGGQPAALNFLLLERPDGTLENCPKAAGVVVPQGGLISHRTSGGGGYGDPRARERERVRSDVLDGYISEAAAQEAYGRDEDQGRSLSAARRKYMSPANGQPAQCDLLIRNGVVVTMNQAREVLQPGAIAIADGRIEAVGVDSDVAARFTARKELDAHGCAVHPGYVDAHVHPTQHLIRWAFPESFRYEDTLEFYIDFILSLTWDDEYAGTQLACLEMVRRGTTTFLEGCGSVLEPDAAAAAIDEVGLRGFLGDPYVWDLGGVWSERLKKRVPTDQRRALSILGHELKRNKNPGSRVRGHVAVTGHATASTELLLAARACAEENGVVLNMHQSYATSDTETDDRIRGEHPLVHFDRVGALSGVCTFAHMNVVREDELAPIADSGMAVVWCPSASMMWGCAGTTTGPHLELFRRGVPVALGSDASNFSGNLDVADQGFLALLTARERAMQPDALLADDVLTMCTLNGARAVGMQADLGSIEVGKHADVVIRRADLPEAEPGLDPIRDLVLATRSSSVDTVIVGGDVIVEHGRSTRVDEDQARARAAAAARQLLARMGRPAPRPREDGRPRK